MKKPWYYVADRVRMLDLLPEYQDLVRRGLLPFSPAWDLSRLPPAQQPAVFRMWRRGVKASEITRTVSAMLETDTQETFPEAAAVEQVSHRFGTLLHGIARQLGRCYSREDLALLSWVVTGDVDAHLELVGLLVKQLRAIEDALRRAKARQRSREVA